MSLIKFIEDLDLPTNLAINSYQSICKKRFIKIAPACVPFFGMSLDPVPLCSGLFNLAIKEKNNSLFPFDYPTDYGLEPFCLKEISFKNYNFSENGSDYEKAEARAFSLYEESENLEEIKIKVEVHEGEMFSSQKQETQKKPIKKVDDCLRKSKKKENKKKPQNRMKNIPGLIVQRIKSLIQNNNLFWLETCNLLSEEEKSEIKQFVNQFNKEDKTWKKIIKFISRNTKIGLKLIQIIVQFLKPENNYFLEEWLEKGKMNEKVKSILRNSNDIKIIQNKFLNIEYILKDQKRNNFHLSFIETENYEIQPFKKVKSF